MQLLLDGSFSQTKPCVAEGISPETQLVLIQVINYSNIIATLQ